MSCSSPRTLAFVAAVATLLLVLTAPSDASANRGTVKEILVPIAATMFTVVPKPHLEIPSDGGPVGVSMVWRINPVTFVLTEAAGTLAALPFVEISGLRLNDGAERLADGSVRFAGGGRLQWFYGWVGTELQLGGMVSTGSQGPGGLVGTGAMFGGQMGSIGLHYRHTWASPVDYHEVYFDLVIAYPFGE